MRITKTCLLLLIILATYNFGFSQKSYKIYEKGLTGFYSAVVKGRNGKQLTHIYIYEISSSKNGKQSLIYYMVEQFEKKRPKPPSTKSFFLATQKETSSNSFILKRYNGPFSYRTAITNITKNSNFEISVEGNTSYNDISGKYKKYSIHFVNNTEFMDYYYEKIFNSRRVMISRNREYIFWARQDAKRGGYNRDPINGIKLKSKLQPWIKLHNNETLKMYYDYTNLNSKIAPMEVMSSSVRDLLLHRAHFSHAPLLFYLPNLKKINLYDSKSEELNFIITLEKSHNYMNFNVRKSKDGIAREKEQLLAIKQKKEDEQKRKEELEREREEAQRQRDLADAKGGINPSGEIIRVDNSPKGGRVNSTMSLWSSLIGRDAAQQLQKSTMAYFGELSNYTTSSYDPVDLFKSIFYGKFSDFDRRHIDHLYNGFIYYANQAYGDSYYPNMENHSFNLITETTRENPGNRYAAPIETESIRQFNIYMPLGYKEKFDKYLNEEQLSQAGGEFPLKFVIISFLQQYDPQSLAFKQMMINIYNYANRLPPVSSKVEIEKRF